MIEKTRLDAQHPYPGPSSFDEEHAAFFHGRADEGEELFALVELRPLTVLYSKSGLGKTSLLQAGLFPRLRRAGLVPVRIRLGFGVDESGARHPPLSTQVRQGISEALLRGDLDGAPPRDDESLWEYFHWTGLWDAGGRPVTVVLVLDQFEEVFTLGHDRGGELAAMVRELSDLVENRIPAELRDAAQEGRAALPPSYDAAGAKVLIALREEFLAHLDDHRRQMPSLGAGRYRLRPLGGAAAKQAVLEPGREVVTEDVAERIVRRLVNAGDEAPLESVEEVEPALLALYCHELNALRDRERLPRIDLALLRGSENDILDRFYERCLRGMPDAVRRLVEERLLTGDKRRDTIAIGRVGDLGVAEGDVQVLVDRRLLRKEPRLGHAYVEIVHDKLVPTIAKKRDERKRIEKEKADRLAQEEAQRRREDELHEQALEEKERAEQEKLRAEAERARADAERLRADAEKQLAADEKKRAELYVELAQSRNRSNAILRVLAAAAVLAAIGVPSYARWENARQKDKEDIAAARGRAIANEARATELADLGWRAAAEQRWDDVARLVSSAYGALDEARTQRARYPIEIGGVSSAPSPLALLASRFEATAGSIEAIPDDRVGVQRFALSADGRFGAALSGDGRAVTLIEIGSRRTWPAEPPGLVSDALDKDAGPLVEPTDAFSGVIQKLVLSGDGATLFALGDGGRIVAWRVVDGRRRLGLRVRLARPSLDVDRAGGHVLLWDRDADRALAVALDPEAGRLLGHTELGTKRARGKAPSAGRWEHAGALRGLALTPDGRRVIGLWDSIWARLDGSRERRAETRIEAWTLPGKLVDDRPLDPIAQHTIAGRVESAAVSEDSTLLAALTDDGQARVLRVAGNAVAPFSALPHRLGADASIAFHRSEQALLITEGGTLSLWDVGSAEPAPRFEVPLGGRARKVALSADARRALVWLDDEVRLYDTALAQPRGAALLPDAERRDSAGSNVELRFRGDDAEIITAKDDGIRVRSLESGRPLDRFLWGEATSEKALYATQIPRLGLVEDAGGDGEQIAVLADGAISIVRANGAGRLDVGPLSARDAVGARPLGAGAGDHERALRAMITRAGRVAALDREGSLRIGDARFSTVRHAKTEQGWGGLLALADGGAWAATAGRGPKVHVWDADNGLLAWTGDLRQMNSKAPATGDELAVTAVAVTADAPERPRAIVGDARGGLRAMITGGEKGAEWSTIGFTPGQHAAAVRAIEIAPNGRIASGAEDGTIALWEKDGRVVVSTASQPPAPVRALRFADEGRAVIGATGSVVRVWKSSDGSETCAVPHADQVVRIAAPRGAGAHAASVDATGTALVWSIASCKVLRTLRGMAYVGFLSGARAEIVSVRKSGRVELWPTSEPPSAEAQDRPRGASAWGTFLGDRALLTGDEEGSIFTWAADSPSPLPARIAGDIGGVIAVAASAIRAVALTPEGAVRGWSGDAGEGIAARLPLDPGFSVRSGALSADGASLLTIEDGADGALRARVSPFPARPWIAPAPFDLRGGAGCEASSAILGARVFATGSTSNGLRALVVEGTGCARIWDAGGKLRVEGNTGSADPSARVAAAALSRAGDRVVLGGADGAISVWAIEADPARGADRLRRLATDRRRHGNRVRAITFHPDGRFFVTAGDDRQAWLWDAHDGRALARLGALPGAILWAAFRSDGNEVVIGGAGGWIRAFSTRTHAADPEAVLRAARAFLPELGAPRIGPPAP